MNKEHQNNERFVEQDAPRKNTDRAFVKVGKDGTPQFPETKETNKSNKEQIKEDAPGNTDHEK